MSRLRVVRIDLDEANAFVSALHRHHQPVIGHLFSIGAALDGKIVGKFGRAGKVLKEFVKAGVKAEVPVIEEAAKAEAEQQTVKAREALREQVAVLAVKGAEQILHKEVNAGVHADLLNRLKTEL